MRISTSRLMHFLAALTCSAGASAADPAPVSDFEQDANGWRYYGGFEFPGAQGSIATVSDAAHSGQHALRIQADFSKGGRYVAATYTLPTPREISGVAVWVKTADVKSLGLRIVDSTDQIFQFSALPLHHGNEWQEVVLHSLKSPNVVWGGAGDKAFHQPAKSCAITVGAGPEKTTLLYLDDFRLVDGGGQKGN